MPSLPPFDPKAFGVQDAPVATTRRRVVATVYGRWHSGKTFMCMAAPGPVCYFGLDRTYLGTVEKFDGQPVVVRPHIFRVSPDILGAGEDQKAAEKEMMAAAGATWGKLRDELLWAVSRPGDFRTIAVDSGSDIWKLVRLARFGKASQVPPDRYTPVNAEMDMFWSHMFETSAKNGINIIYAMREAEVFEEKEVATPDGKKKIRRGTGKYKPDGCHKNQLFFSNVILNTRLVDGGGREVVVVDNKLRMEMVGQVFDPEVTGWAEMMVELQGGKVKEWR